MNTTTINPGDRLLTEAELYLHYIHMTVERSCNIGAIERYVPEDLLWQGESSAANAFSASARERLADTDQPESELEQLVDDLQCLVEAFRNLLSDFGSLKRRSAVWPLPAPEDAPDETRAGYHEIVRYRRP